VAKPVVDRLERTLQGRAAVLRVDALGGIGPSIARRYDVRATPTLLVFDGQGNLVYSQAGMPNAGAIEQTVNGLLAR
jgi:hypothetical protein